MSYNIFKELYELHQISRKTLNSIEKERLVIACENDDFKYGGQKQ